MDIHDIEEEMMDERLKGVNLLLIIHSVVPYNKYLLLKYNAHINVEWCNQSRSVKYLFKYVHKGHDRVTTSFYALGEKGCQSQCVDEVKLYYDCRYLSPCEAAWRIFSFDIHYREPSVERLSFHLPNEQFVVYDAMNDLENIVVRNNSKKTKFLAWMDANAIYEEAKNLTYCQYPQKFVWNDIDHEWYPRKRGFKIGRMHFVPPGSDERYYLRMLLGYVRGPTSYEDIRNVNDIVYPTFKDACYAMNLLDDDGEYIDAIKEASL